MKRSEFDTLHRKYMSKKLTINQLMALERLTSKEYTLIGTPRKNPRVRWESEKLGIPHDHYIAMRKISIENTCLSPLLKQRLLESLDLNWPNMKK